MLFPKHTLADGRKIILTSKHGYNFSDGTSVPGVDADFPLDYLDALSVKRKFREIPEALPNRATESTQELTPDTLSLMTELSREADIILVSHMVISAMKEMGVRNQFPKVLGFNSTPETARCGNPSEKVVDINNWAW